MYFLSLLCGMWSGSMEIGDFIWQFYISPPPHPHFHMLTLILTTQTLWRQEKKFIKIWTLWFFYRFSYAGLRSSHRSISLPNFFTFHCTSISIWKEREFRCDFLLYGLLTRMIALAGHKYENLIDLRHIASFHDKLLQSSWVPGGYSKWGHGYISIFMFLCSISCIWCISSICVFKLLLHFPSLKWTDDQRGEQQEVISSENICGAEVPWETSEKLFTKDKFLRKAPLKEFLAKLDVIVFEIIDF